MAKQSTIKIGPQPPRDVADLFRRVLTSEEATSMDVLMSVRAACLLFDTTVQGWIGQDAISPSRVHVLMVLWAAERPVPQMHLVKALKVSRASISRLIEQLHKVAIVTLIPDTRDRRNVLIELTAKGKALAHRMTKSNAARMMTALRGLTFGEQSELVRLLSLARASFDRNAIEAGRIASPLDQDVE